MWKSMWKCLSDKWVPHTLTDGHKAERVQCCENLLQTFTRNRNIKRYLIVTDEKWFYGKPLGNIVTRKSWVPPDGDRCEVAKRMTVEMKFLALVAVSFGSLHHFKVLNRHETVNSEVYTQFLDEAINKFNSYELRVQRRSVSWDTCILMHDNATPHTSLFTTQFLQHKGCTLIRQPPYSPDVNICDRMVFPKAEMKRSGITFHEPNDVVEYLHKEFQTLTEQVMDHEFDMLTLHLRNVIDNNGNYV